MSKPVSDHSQLAALDAVITALRRGIMPIARERDMLADQLGSVRDRVARARAAANVDQKRARHRDLRAAYREDARRG